MIKYRTKLIEKLTHGRAVSHMLKTIGGMVKPPDVVTCFGSYKVNTRPLIDWQAPSSDESRRQIRLHFTYSRNNGPIQRVMIDDNTEDWDAIDLLYSKLDSDLCRAQDGESLAFYLLSDGMGVMEQVIPDLNDTHMPVILLPPIEATRMARSNVPEQPTYDYTITGISGDGLIPIKGVFNVDARKIAIPQPASGVDLDDIDGNYPRWYPSNNIVKEDNTIVIYPSDNIDDFDFDLFRALGGEGNTPITITSCVKAVPRKYICEASHVVGSQVSPLMETRVATRMAMSRGDASVNSNREPVRFSDAPFPFKPAGWRGDTVSWPPSIHDELSTRGHDWIASYRRNDGPLKVITWNTGPRESGAQHSVWDAIKELLLDDYGRTAFMLSDFNSTASSHNGDGDVTVKSGIGSNLKFTTKPSEEGEPLDRSNQPYRYSGKSVEVRDRQIQFSDENAGAVWNENTITIYPTPWEVITDYGFDGQLDYYEYLCQYRDQLNAGEPITIHSCAAVEPADHIQVNTSITLNSPEKEEVPRMMGQGLSAAIRLNDGAVKYFKFEPNEVNVALNEILTYLYFMGKTPEVTISQGDGTVLKINDLYFRSNFTAHSSEISGCSGTERDQEFWMPVGNPMDYEDPNSTPSVSILETPEPYKRESNKATFIKHPVNGYTDLFDLIKYTSGNEHTIYSSAVVPSVIWNKNDDGDGPVDPEPSDDDLSGIKPFTFTNVSKPGTTGITKFDIGMSNTDGYWEIRESGQLIASPNHRADGVGFDSNRDDYKSIVIYNMNGVTRDFEVYVRASTVSVRIENLHTKPGDVELKVTSFGNVSPKMIFRVGNGIVYLPETFPPHITDCEGMFNNGHNIGSDITGWDMSNVTNMAFMFADCRAFNQDISGWNVSNVTQMHSMFWAAYKFNQDLSKWCVTNITSYPNGFASEANAWTQPKPVWGTCPKQDPLPSDEDGIFKFTVTGASQRDTMSLSLTDPVGEWRLMRGDTLVRDSSSYGNVVNFTNGNNEVCDYTFIGAGTSITLGTIAGRDDVTLVEITKLPTAVQGFSFPMRNANLVVPDVLPTNITSLKHAFNENYKFNQDLSKWDTSNVTDMTYTFAFAKAFNGSIGSWNTKSVTTMNSMFFGATAFNQPIGDWDVSNVTHMGGMFNQASAFNKPIGLWLVGKVTDMSSMFSEAKAFNQDISDWDISNVTQLLNMFYTASEFNQDIGGWDTSKVTLIGGMFLDASSFNQDLSRWCVANIKEEPYDFKLSADAWTLPKPVWGTCPAPKPDLPDGTPLEFNIYSPSTNNPVVPLTITIKSPESGWKLYENNTLVCSRWTNGPGIHTINDNSGLITIQIDRNNLMDKTVNYKLFAKTDRVRVSRGYSNLTGASPSIDVISFSDSCASQAFGFEWANLTVPTVLPPCITNAHAMFENCRRFNQDLSMWNTSNILYMSNMFATCSNFNGDVSTWDVSNVVMMESMFARATNFNQDLSGWNVVNIPTEPNNFAVNATQWTLPKPIWGTSGGTIVEPVGDTFEFTVVSEDTTAGAKPLVMNLGMGEDTWQLTSDGTVVASPTTTVEGITVENKYGDRIITISNLRARTVNYVLTLKSSMLQLGDKNYTIAANNRAINITKFSDTVDLFKFNLDHTGLTVPNSIPTTLTSLGEMFAYCKTFNDPAVTYWNTENITNMAGTFDRCNAFNQPLNWSTHQVTTMKAMFRNCPVFDQDINNWNVGQVTDMESMFMGCRVFNQPLNDWNVSSVTKMTELFRDCKQFNKYIANWDVSKVDSFEFCFSSATAFNEDISIWNVKSARWMDYMFSGATSFNQNLSGWCVTGVDSKPPKFDDGALAWRKQRPIWGTCPLEKSPEPLDPTVFNAEVKLGKYDYQYKTKIVLDISNDSSDWEVYYNGDLVASPTVGGPDWTFVQKVGNNVTINPNSSSALVTVRGTMKNLKLKVEAFPQTDPAVKISHFSNTISSYAINTGYAPLSVPTTLPGVVNSMAMMFNGTNNIVTDITGWDTTNITDMQYLFSGCGAFNQDIGSWNTVKVTNMEALFSEAWKFNGNIGQWDTGNVTNMAYMFYNSHAFNQDLSGWNVSLIPTKPDSFGDQWLPDWTLPKPNWGSDGKSPEVDFTDAFEFNVTSPLNGGFELSMSDVVGSYSIYVDDVLHSTGSETYPGKRFSDIPQGSVNYKIVANCAALKLMTTSGYTLTDLTVTSFGNNINIARFSLGNIKLTVPTTLPSHMTNLSGMFSGSYKFNQDLSGWDVSRVTNMSSMFYQAKTFNGNISNWDMGNVTDMTLMLKSCELFNQDISGWNVSKCTKMTELFYSAEIFNQDISRWQVGSVSNMDRMFYAAKKFNQDLSGWNVGLISVEPSSFAPYTPVWVLPKPIWGTSGTPPDLRWSATSTTVDQDVVDVNATKRINGVVYKSNIKYTPSNLAIKEVLAKEDSTLLVTTVLNKLIGNVSNWTLDLNNNRIVYN